MTEEQMKNLDEGWVREEEECAREEKREREEEDEIGETIVSGGMGEVKR